MISPVLREMMQNLVHEYGLSDVLSAFALAMEQAWRDDHE